MGISRKLYTGFGSILGILLLLFLVSFIASQHEHTARNSAASALSNLDKIGRVRSQMMANRLDLRPMTAGPSRCARGNMQAPRGPNQ